MPGRVTPPAAEIIQAWLDAQPDLQAERVGDGGWFVALRGERKRTIPAHLLLGAHTLVIESLFMRAPDENPGAVYAYLLRRNLRSYLFRFALSDAGDVLLVAVVPVHAVTADELDRLIGALLYTADETFNAALRIGFASYIDREQDWRRRVGAPVNPITRDLQ
ncbi:MAG: YbjN domain-containing protein [Egibacteraceae bacterium]